MRKPYRIIKIGGNEIAEPGFTHQLATAINKQQAENACIVVHGGGRAIDEWMNKMGITPRYKSGQRITDEKTLEVAEMILSGKINKMLVLALSSVELDAIGLSGVDRNLLQVESWGEEMNLVGRIISVRSELFEEFNSQDVVPVISPISSGPGGRYNVNADHAAGMIAGAIEAESVIFISNVPGVMVNNSITAMLSDTEVQTLIQNGTIHGGMIPKVNAAMDALRCGAKSAVISDLDGFNNQTGTTIIRNEI